MADVKPNDLVVISLVFGAPALLALIIHPDGQDWLIKWSETLGVLISALLTLGLILLYKSMKDLKRAEYIPRVTLDNFFSDDGTKLSNYGGVDREKSGGDFVVLSLSNGGSGYADNLRIDGGMTFYQNDTPVFSRDAKSIFLQYTEHKSGINRENIGVLSSVETKGALLPEKSYNEAMSGTLLFPILTKSGIYRPDFRSYTQMATIIGCDQAELKIGVKYIDPLGEEKTENLIHIEGQIKQGMGLYEFVEQGHPMYSQDIYDEMRAVLRKDIKQVKNSLN